MFAASLSKHDPDLNMKYFDVCNGQFPGSLEECDAYLCTGSRYSVYDDIEWIHSLKKFVRQVSAVQLPFVGVCFGHQLLAEALGGKTARATQGWGVGIHRLQIVQSEEWMKPPRTSCALNFMHRDQVQSLPKNGVLLGKTDHCPISMFQVGQTMLGVQAHSELSSAYCEALLSDRIESIGEAKVRRAKLSLEQPADDDVAIRWIVSFLRSRG